MKKKTMFALIAFIAILFAACNTKKDEPTNPTESSSEEINENGIKNEFGDGRLIIGGWEVTRGAYHFVFKSDGSCIQDGYSYESGIWSYNPETKTLATTMGSWTWNMNIIAPEALQGTYITKGTSYGFNHSGRYSHRYVDANPKLIIGKWKTKEGKQIIFYEKKCSLDDATAISYAIEGINPDNYEAEVYITFDGKEKYSLEHLSGGYIKIGSDKETGKYSGSYYYVTE